MRTEYDIIGHIKLLEEKKMGDVICINEYKRRHGIAIPRSPYYTLNATQEQLSCAYRTAVLKMKQHKNPPYAVLIGYENIKTGHIKLLKQIRMYSSQEAFESMSGIGGFRCVAVVKV